MPEPEKKLIEVTVEKRLRVCKEIEATEEEIEFLRRGENPLKVNLVTRRWSMAILNGILQLLMSTVEQL